MKERQKAKKLEEYTFLDHLEELRWRIIKIIIAFGLFLILSLFFVPSIFSIIKMPIEGIEINLNVFSFQGYFFAYLKVAFITSLILTFPVAIYQLSAFILPGLYPKEKKWFYITISLSALFFIVGIVFSYLVLTPISFNFLYNFATNSGNFSLLEDISKEITLLPGLNQYIDLFLLLIILTGFAFQLPLVIMFLTKIDIIDYTTLHKYRAHSLVIILILSALFTPPDIITQLILGIPLYLLFEISILLSRLLRRIEEKKADKIYNVQEGK